jgi:16S rRNA (guanine966-N2)-methyltransferase
MIRIVTGKHRGRKLAVPEDGPEGNSKGDGVRPTTDRAREGLFNTLAHGDFSQGGQSVFSEARVLDAFAGCGALGLEALSRGAAHASFLEIDRQACAVIAENLDHLSETARGKVLRGDALRPPQARAGACDLIFLDPPYRKDMAAAALLALVAASWVAPDAVVAVEQERGETLAAPEGFEQIDERRYGRAQFTLLRYRVSSQS